MPKKHARWGTQHTNDEDTFSRYKLPTTELCVQVRTQNTFQMVRQVWLTKKQTNKQYNSFNTENEPQPAPSTSTNLSAHFFRLGLWEVWHCDMTSYGLADTYQRIEGTCIFRSTWFLKRGCLSTDIQTHPRGQSWSSGVIFMCTPCIFILYYLLFVSTNVHTHTHTHIHIYISPIYDKSVTTQNLSFLSYWYRKKRLQMHF